MAIFVVLTTDESPQFAQALERVVPGNYFKVADGQWLVSAITTPQKLADALGISEEGGHTASGIVATIGSYWGRANPEIWQWLATRMVQK
jgi:hypothetical protein